VTIVNATRKAVETASVKHERWNTR